MVEPTEQMQAWLERHPQRLRQGCPNHSSANLAPLDLTQLGLTQLDRAHARKGGCSALDSGTMPE